MISYKLKVYEIEIIVCILSNFSVFKDELREIGAIIQESEGYTF